MTGEFDSETYREIQSDGLLDLLLGSLIIVFFLFEVAEVVGGVLSFLPAVLLVLLVGGLVVTRRVFTYPRVGEPGDSRAVVFRRILAAAAALFGMGVTLGLLVAVGEYGESQSALWTGLSLLAGAVLTFGLLATILRVPHLWVYAAIYGSPFFLWSLLDTAGMDSDPLPFLTLATLGAFALGIANLVRFRKRHPHPPQRGRAAHQTPL